MSSYVSLRVRRGGQESCLTPGLPNGEAASAPRAVLGSAIRWSTQGADVCSRTLTEGDKQGVRA